MICKICGQDKPLHTKSGLCGNCYNKTLFASKSPEDQERIRINQRRLKAAWQKAHPGKNKQYVKTWRETHPNELKKNQRIAKMLQNAPKLTLKKAGIDTPFMRQQLEEHRKQELMSQIEAGMKLIGV